ncbi:uncharacterized protein LOC123866023 [Maniola jurtina]|uniref:uncharacterized protein LOC123866023 n=1 Tax=Maniola jurtina TaxID=191418 RepID=UPI001E689051|nr:uncharacterized protein LOC123866023 [Maniola jurtina]
MEYHNIHSTSKSGERVTSTYAEIYFNDSYCEPKTSEVVKHPIIPDEDEDYKEEWTSPSDLLIGLLELKPPFTSKITRGKTHEGILAIGNAVLDKERAKFLSSLTTLLEDNDAAWVNILINEKQKVDKKVKAVFLDIFNYKSEIMKREVSNFYEYSLQELEEHLRSEIQTVLKSVRANIVSYLNNEIRQKLRKERKILVDVLAKKYVSEVQNMKKYYKILLDNELCRNNALIHKAVFERNAAVKAFYKQIESERLTSTMYVMSLERKKCQIKKMLLEHLHTAEISEKLQKIKDKEDEINALNKKDVRIADINKQWQEKINKILRIFLKFISFSLKILPEQTTFLLDLEKMVVLQLNEIQKNPNIISTVLFEEKEQLNVFEFPASEQVTLVCDKEPFVLVGDVSESMGPHYGSRETLPCDVDLPYFRLDRKYFYAKCHGYESIKKFLDSQLCKCNLTIESDALKSLSNLGPKMIDPTFEFEPRSKENEVIRSESSNESLLIEDISRLKECPDRKCCDWIKRNTFPYLASYLDYNEENFKRVIAILGQVPEKEVPAPEVIYVNDIAKSELPFAATKELHHTVETQYSSQEDLTLAEIKCSCISNTLIKHTKSHYMLKTTSSEALHEILQRRKTSLQRLIDKNPNLLKIFTDESFDCKL